MRTSELTGAALDWAVAQCEGTDFFALMEWDDDRLCYLTQWGEDFEPSMNWQQAGRIIEREKIELEWGGNGGNENWWACINADEDHSGETPLIAAMRCYVASKLGDDVEVPTELTQGE